MSSIDLENFERQMTLALKPLVSLQQYYKDEVTIFSHD